MWCESLSFKCEVRSDVSCEHESAGEFVSLSEWKRRWEGLVLAAAASRWRGGADFPSGQQPILFPAASLTNNPSPISCILCASPFPCPYSLFPFLTLKKTGTMVQFLRRCDGNIFSGGTIAFDSFVAPRTLPLNVFSQANHHVPCFFDGLKIQDR